MSFILLFPLLPGWLQAVLIGTMLLGLFEQIAKLVVRVKSAWSRGKPA